MKYYLVIFSDYSETVGKQTSRAAMERDARQYCKMWGLSETVREVQEITAEEYSRRTGKPTEEPAEKPAKKKSNRIPRNARKIFVTWLIDTTGNKAGDAATVEKDDRGQWIETTASGERYAVPVSMLRNADIIRIEKIETTEDASETIPTEETAPAYIVQCRSPRRPWTDYSSPATLEECETIKERAEARRTCDVNGNLLQYRIAPAEAPQTATTDADGETSTAPQREPQRARSINGTLQSRICAAQLFFKRLVVKLLREYQLVKRCDTVHSLAFPPLNKAQQRCRISAAYRQPAAESHRHAKFSRQLIKHNSGCTVCTHYGAAIVCKIVFEYRIKHITQFIHAAIGLCY